MESALIPDRKRKMICFEESSLTPFELLTISVVSLRYTSKVHVCSCCCLLLFDEQI